MLYSFAHVHFFSFLFFPPLLSGPYLWNRYSQRLQVECAAWSCCLILHYSLPSNLLRFFCLFFFRHDFVAAISLEPSLGETPDCVCCLVLLSNFALLLTIQFASLFYFIIFLFFSATILSGPYLWNRYSQRLQIECAAWSCSLILHCCLPSNSLCYFFFCHDFVAAISLEPSLVETPDWVCCLVLLSNFALLLTIQFANFFFFFVRRRVFHLRGIAPRSHTGRPRTCLVIFYTVDLAIVRRA